MSDAENKDTKGKAPEVAAAAADGDAAETKTELKVVNRPNDAAIKKEQDKLSRIITEHHNKLQEIKAQLDALTGTRGPGGAGGSNAPAGPPSPAQVIRDKLKALQKRIRESIDKSKGMREEMNKLDAQKKTALDKVKKMRAELDFFKEEDIDREIAKLEDKVAHSSMSITEEKKIVSKIGSLRASKRAVGEQAAFSAQISTLDEKRKEIGAQVRVVSDGITKLKEEESGLRTELNKLNDEYKSKRADVPALLKKKEEVRKVLRTNIEAQKKLRENTDKQYAEWKAYRKEADRIAREERNKARAARAAEAGSDGEEGEEGEDGEEGAKLGAWAKEITACNDLVVYLEAIKAKKAAAAASAAKAAAAAPKEANLEGVQIMKGKRSANDSFMNIGGGKPTKTAGGGKKGGKKADTGSENLSHGLDTLLYFSTIELQPAATFAEIDDCIAAIRERKAHYETDPPKPEKKAEAAGDGKKKDNKKKESKGASTKVINDGPGPSPATSAPAPSGAWANRAKA